MFRCLRRIHLCQPAGASSAPGFSSRLSGGAGKTPGHPNPGARLTSFPPPTHPTRLALASTCQRSFVPTATTPRCLSPYPGLEGVQPDNTISHPPLIVLSRSHIDASHGFIGAGFRRHQACQEQIIVFSGGFEVHSDILVRPPLLSTGRFGPKCPVKQSDCSLGHFCPSNTTVCPSTIT